MGHDPLVHPHSSSSLILSVSLFLPLVLGGCGDGGSLSSRPSLVAQAQKQKTARAATRYQRKEGLHIDMPYLLGREYAVLEPEIIAEQLGALKSREVLADEQVILSFDKTTVSLWKGRIASIQYPFPDPLDRKTAYGVCGFPLDMGPPLEATLETRVNHYWGMRRISLMRTAPQSQKYKEIKVWKLFPMEQN